MLDRKEIDKLTRPQVLERDNFKCIMCGKRGVEVHEIVPKSALGKTKSDILFNVKNRVSLCRDCHSNVHNRKARKNLLKLLLWRYNYEYSEPEFTKYLGEDE